MRWAPTFLSSRIFRVLLLVFACTASLFVHAAAPQQTRSANTSRVPPHRAASTAPSRAPKEIALTETSFTAHGLTNESTLAAIYTGNFDGTRMERDDLQFTALTGSYMNAYWDECKDYLTSDRTEIMRQRCVRSSHWVNGYGVQTSADSCDEWVTEGTGKFADRSLYRAANALEGQTTKKTMGNVIQSVVNAKTIGDLFSGQVNQAGAAVSMKADAASVIGMNGCTSPGLMRFQQNMLQFALGKQGIPLNGTQRTMAALETAPAGAAFRDSNYDRLLDDMVSVQSGSWMFNKYIPGSVHGATVASRDASGRPASVRGSYRFTGISGPTTGGVTLTFTDGLPECLYFSDLPNNCVTPNRRLITAYGNGDYR